jgi:hypothetical protein
VTATQKRKRKNAPSVRRSSARKGNHPANPYPAPAGRLEDREGYPWPGASHQRPELHQKPAHPPPLPPAPSANAEDEPTFVLRASDPLAAMLLRCWAGLSSDFRTQHPDTITAARRIALGMDLWASKNRGVVP